MQTNAFKLFLDVPLLGYYVISIFFFSAVVPAVDKYVSDVHCCSKAEMNTVIHCGVKACLGGGWCIYTYTCVE